MSLFGGNSTEPSIATEHSEEEDSDFSITPIQSPVASSNSAQGVDFAQLPLDYDEQPEPSFDGVSEEDEEALYEEESGRLNRFKGTPAQWKNYTREERTLADSLDQLKVSDLSIHLYNAHAWNAKLRHKDNKSTPEPWHSKSRWIAKDEKGDRPWGPDKSWTAWPLELEVVPGPRKLFGAPDAGTLVDPREHLEDELHGVVERRARTMWNDREWEKPAARRPSGSSKHSSRSPSTTTIGDDEDQSRPQDLEACQRASDETEDEEISHMRSKNVISYLPEPTADVVRLQAILRPSVNHILSQIDSLLMALHHSRQAAYTRGASSDRASSSRSRSRSRSGRRTDQRRALKRSHSCQRTSPDRSIDDGHSSKRTRSSISSAAPSEDSQGRSRSVGSAKSAQSESESHHLNPRDWSEVIGLAAMIGWDAAVIQRAANRCSALFGEGMSFRLLPEHSEMSSKSPLQCLPKHGLVPGVLEEPSKQVPTGPDPIVYTCPEQDCLRHSKVFVTTEGYRFREHLRRKHGYDADEIYQIELAMHMSGSNVPSTKTNPRGWIPPDPLLCPHQGCTKSIGQPFPLSRRLVEHMRRIHKYDPRQQSPPGRPPMRRRSTDRTSEADSQGTTAMESDDEMVGGVHNDGFLKPVSHQVRGRGRDKKDRPKTR